MGMLARPVRRVKLRKLWIIVKSSGKFLVAYCSFLHSSKVYGYFYINPTEFYDKGVLKGNLFSG